MTSYVAKAALPDPEAKQYVLRAQKTMYRGKDVRVGDEIFLFWSENDGGQGLIARGIVIAVAHPPVSRADAKIRHTPRVGITVRRVARAKRPLGRRELKAFVQWDDGRPETELSFKFYRQATNKIAGVTEETAAFLRTFF